MGAGTFSVVRRSDQYPGEFAELSGPGLSRGQAERAAEIHRAHAPAYVEICIEEDAAPMHPRDLTAAEVAEIDPCLCCGLTKAPRPALPAWMRPAE